MMQSVKRKRLSCNNTELKKGSSSMSEKQRCLMLDFLREHPNMVLDRSVGGPSNRNARDQLWQELAAILNKCESGAQKDGGGWRRSWQDLKRYESLKAKESMAKLCSVDQLPQLELSPLQEKIANLLNLSISDVSSNGSVQNSKDKEDGPMSPQNERLPSITEQSADNQSKYRTKASEKTSDVAEQSLVHAMQNIADALNERNSIEERKVKVFENFLSLYASKNQITTTNFI